MQKLITLVAVLTSICATAQEQPATIKQQVGSITAEVNFNPFSSSPINLSYLRFRKFTSDLTAFRFGISMGAKSEKPSEDETATSFMLNIRPGFEKHFAGTNRLSPYVGFDLDLALKSATYSDEEIDVEIKGAWSDNGFERGFTRFGLNSLVGADYYVSKSLYIGTEFGFGFEVVKTADIKVSVSGNEVDDFKGGSTFELGPNFNSSLRLGFIF